MKAVYWLGLALGVALVLFGYFGDNVRWLIYVGVAVVVIAGAFNPKRPFYGLRK